jgi:putative membrane protein
MMWHWDAGMDITRLMLMVVANLFFVGIIVLGIVALARYVTRQATTPAGRTGAAEHILAERFARGEIGPEDYQERLRILRGQPPQS